jgi:hypothetical protein
MWLGWYEIDISQFAYSLLYSFYQMIDSSSIWFLLCLFFIQVVIAILQFPQFQLQRRLPAEDQAQTQLEIQVKNPA